MLVFFSFFPNRRLEVGIDEANKGAESAVDTSEAGLSTAIAPRNETLEDAVGIDDGAAAVALARVLATLGLSGAEHVGGDSRPAVLGLAGGTRDDGDGNLPQGGGERRAALGGGAPASGGDDGTSSRVRAGSGKGGVADGGALRDRAGQLPDSNVEVGGTGVVGGVHNDPGDTDLGTA